MINYHVDIENRTVRAYLSGCRKDVVKRMRKLFGESTFATKSALYRAALIHNEYTGCAKCHPDDAFDIEEGKRLAKKRLLDKYHTARIKALNRVDVMLDTMSNTVMMEINTELQRCVEKAAKK